jgi:hypothetical protein
MIFKFQGETLEFVAFEHTNGTLAYVFIDQQGKDVKIEYQTFTALVMNQELELV